MTMSKEIGPGKEESGRDKKGGRAPGTGNTATMVCKQLSY